MKLPKYAITILRHFYGPQTKLSLRTTEHESEFARFDSRKTAHEEISRLESTTYYLSHNESGHPTYKVVTVGSRAFQRAHRHWSGGLEYTGQN